MKYWIDETSETDNVIVFTESAIVIGSVDKTAIESVNSHLKEKKSPLEVLGSEDLLTIPFAQVHGIESRNTDSSISVKYKAKKDLEDKELNFSDVENKLEAIKVLNIILPDTLSKKVYQQSALVAVISPILSLAIAVWCSYLFINKLRWLTIIIGGIWTLWSAYMVFDRFTNPPEITRWTIKGKYARKTWYMIKTAFALVILAAIVTNVHRRFPDAYGEASLYEHIQYDEWKDEGVAYFVDNGANVNYLDEDGDSLIWIAASYGDLELVKQLLEAGADATFINNNDESVLNVAVNNQEKEIVKLLLESGAKFSNLDEMFADSVYYSGNTGIAELLLEAGANVNAEYKEGQTVLERIIRESDDEELVEFLIGKGAATDFTIDDKSIVDYLNENDKTYFLKFFTVAQESEESIEAE